MREDGRRVPRRALFVVATDADERTYERARGSLTGCGDALLSTYFDTRPDWVLACYLFDGGESYGAFVQKRFGHEPTSPYGFYSRAGKCLVMDISTGTGTLVHEMVHAFAEADFPSVPAWFNEGLGSLHEQCSMGADGTLEGLTNWRLPILQKALTAVPTWEELTTSPTTTSTGGQIRERPLPLRLQQQGLYEQFRVDDPFGWAISSARPPDGAAEWRACFKLSGSDRRPRLPKRASLRTSTATHPSRPSGGFAPSLAMPRHGPVRGSPRCR